MKIEREMFTERVEFDVEYDSNSEFGPTGCFNCGICSYFALNFSYILLRMCAIVYELFSLHPNKTLGERTEHKHKMQSIRNLKFFYF